MEMRDLLMWSLLAMAPLGAVGWYVMGLGGVKMALGVVVMFAWTAGIIAYALQRKAVRA